MVMKALHIPVLHAVLSPTVLSLRTFEFADEMTTLHTSTQVTAGNDCPTIVAESETGQCIDSEDPTKKPAPPFYCCNVLRHCKSESTALLNYYNKWVTQYELYCVITNADFRLSGDGQHLSLKESSKDKICGESDDAKACQQRGELKTKPGPPTSPTALEDTCRNRVHIDYWLPQLDAVVWPMDKVEDLDETYASCVTTEPPAGPAPPPTPTLAPPSPAPPPIESPYEAGVDFQFMTSDLAKMERKGGFFSWFNRIFMRKRILGRNSKEELAGGHTCRTRGAEGQTYYASSLCYYIPVKTAPNGELGEAAPIDFQAASTSKKAGLYWSGHMARDESETSADGSMCDFSNYQGQEGKCVKCSVCHDNAMNEEGRPTWTTFFEEIAPAEECLTETAIEELALLDFHAFNRDEKNTVAKCREREFNYLKAQYDLDQAVTLRDMLEELTRTPGGQLSDQIEDEKATIQAEDDKLREIQERERPARDLAKTNCWTYGKSEWWWHKLGAPYNTPLQEVLKDMNVFSCQNGPSRVHCNACDDERKKLQAIADDLTDSQSNKALAESNLIELEKLMSEKTAEYNDWKAEVPGLQTDLDVKKNAWENGDPPGTVCTETTNKYLDDLRAYMRTNIPYFYNNKTTYGKNSCEYECTYIEERRFGGEGCGVMEGNLPRDITGRGGVRAACNPLATSFVMSPYPYQAPQEDISEQCSRVFATQRPKHATKILIDGWLMKRGRNWGWDKRYFVLEAGDHVRTGLLRYFLTEPAGDRRAKERFNKRTILWDADRVIEQDGGKYRWGDGSMCFAIVHFYRWIRLCVPGKGDQASATTVRDEWVRHIRGQLPEGRKAWVPRSGYDR